MLISPGVVGRPCPHCAELLGIDAKVCKHCNRYVNLKKEKKSRPIRSSDESLLILKLNVRLRKIEDNLKRSTYLRISKQYIQTLQKIYLRFENISGRLSSLFGLYVLSVGLAYLAFFAFPKIILIELAIPIIGAGVLIILRANWTGYERKEIFFFRDKSAPCLVFFGLPINLMVVQLVALGILIVSYMTFNLIESRISAVSLVVVFPFLWGTRYKIYGALNGLVGFIYLVSYSANSMEVFEYKMSQGISYIPDISTFIYIIAFSLVFPQVYLLGIGNFKFGHLRGDSTLKIAGSTMLIPFSSAFVLAIFWDAFQMRNVFFHFYGIFLEPLFK